MGKPEYCFRVLLANGTRTEHEYFQGYDRSKLKEALQPLERKIISLAKHHVHPLLTSDPVSDAPKALSFTWDSVRRTESNLRTIDVQAPVANDEDALEAYRDYIGQIMLSNMITSDPMTCRRCTQSELVDFGAEVTAQAADF